MNLSTIDPIVTFVHEYRTNPPWNDLWRRIYDCELVYIKEGNCFQRINNRTYRLRKGNIVIIPPGYWHQSWQKNDRPLVRFCVHFDWNRDYAGNQAPLHCLAGERYDERRIHFVPSEISAYLPLITSISPRHKSIIPALELTMGYLKRHSRIGDMLLGVVLRSILHDMRTKKQISLRRQNKSTKTIMFLKQFIEQHYSEQMDYNKFIALTRLSRGYLCQAFKNLTGHAPAVYLNHIRLEHARLLLADPCMNIAEVGRAVGIPDANYFARLFRKYTGISPTKAVIYPPWPISPAKKPGTHGNSAGKFG